jgi:hypothetical protein
MTPIQLGHRVRRPKWKLSGCNRAAVRGLRETFLYSRFARSTPGPCANRGTCCGIRRPEATAKTVILGGSYSKSTVQKDCNAAGGTFYSGGRGGAYGCNAPGGSVTCSKSGKCTGSCDACRTAGGGLTGVLHGGPNRSGSSEPSLGTKQGRPVHTTAPPTMTGRSSGSRHH